MAANQIDMAMDTKDIPYSWENLSKRQRRERKMQQQVEQLTSQVEQLSTMMQSGGAIPVENAQAPITISFSDLTDETFVHNFGRRASIRIVDTAGVDITSAMRKVHTDNTVRLMCNQPRDGQVTFS